MDKMLLDVVKEEVAMKDPALWSPGPMKPADAKAPRGILTPRGSVQSLTLGRPDKKQRQELSQLRKRLNNPKLNTGKMNAKAAIKLAVEQFGDDANDTGKSEVQVAALTHRIHYMTDHLIKFKKDNHSKRGLHRMIHQRRKILKYLKRKDPERYHNIIEAVGLRDILRNQKVA